MSGRKSTELVDFRIFGYRAHAPSTVAIVTQNPDDRTVLAVSVPIKWNVVRTEDDELWLTGGIPVLQIAETVNTEARRRRGGDPAPDDPPPVSNLGLRAAFHRKCEIGEDTPASLAAKLGWSRQKGGEEVPDRDRVLDTLGIARSRNVIPYETAALICEALQLDPAEVGL